MVECRRWMGAVGMMCLAAAGCAAAPARGAEPDAQVDAADTALAIDEFMCRTVAFGFSGSLLVAKQGRVLVSRGYGHADRAGGVPYTERAVFSIGSITKQFTAAAILKLEMDERLTVLDPIADHLMESRTTSRASRSSTCSRTPRVCAATSARVTSRR